MKGSGTLPGRLGGWSARHRVAAIFGWVAVVVTLTFAGAAVGQRSMTEQEYAAGESATAFKVLEREGLIPSAGEMVLVHSDTVTVTAPEFQATVRELVSTIPATQAVSDVREPYAAGLISGDKHSALV